MLRLQNFTLCSIYFLAPTLFAAPGLPDEVADVLEKHCVSCHGPEKQKGRLRIDELNPDFVNGPDADRWHELLNILNVGEMPPEDEPPLSSDELSTLTGWLNEELDRAAEARRATDGRVVFRRLNRHEYNNTLNDLFGLDLDITHLLPPERPSEDGFTNNGEELVMSPLHFESFLKIARMYLDKALVDDPDEKLERTGFALNFKRRNDGRPEGSMQTFADPSKIQNASVNTFPGFNPKKKDQFSGQILEHSIVLPPARRATGTQIPARRGPQPRIEIPLREFPDSGVVRVRVRAKTVPAQLLDAPVEVGVYQLLPDNDIATFEGQLPTQTVLATDFDLKKLGVQIEKVSLKFSTHLRTVVAGEYTFFTTADDGSRLYINGEEVVNGETVNVEQSGGIHLEPGTHELILIYHDTGGGERLVVDWQGPDFERQTVPASALLRPSAQVVSNGEPRVDVSVYAPALPDTSLKSYAGQRAAQQIYAPEITIRDIGVRIEDVSLKFRTKIEIPASDEYKFYSRADDGARIYINGKHVTGEDGGNQWRDGSAGAIELEKGQHDLVVTYYDTGGGERMDIEWEGPDIKRGPIPAEILTLPEPLEEAEEPEFQPAYLAVMMANRLDDGVEFEPIGETLAVDATDEPGIYEFIGRMENLPLPFRQRSGQSGEINDARLFLVNMWEPAHPTGPQLEIHSVEFEAPLFPEWPPTSHAAIMTSEDPRRLITDFLSRAFRRPPTDAEVGRMAALWDYYAQENPEAPFVEIVREILLAALIHPSFLYLVEPDEDPAAAEERRALTDHELANRLSYFLTSTSPDAELRQLADAGRLRDPETLSKQTQRLIADPRSDRFVAGFIDQWLDLDALERIPVDRKKHATFQPWMRESMRNETRGLFAKILRENRSALELIDSDYLIIDPILANHYGIPGVSGSGFREVANPEGSPRGGILTHASFLTGNSNGVDSHPIKRGVWLLDRLLNDPPPPPPPNVPDLDAEAPEFKGKTLKEQLQIHRDVQACRNCHEQIDPFGLPFESFNTVGQWRNSKDTSATLPDGTEVSGIGELKSYVLTKRKDDFAEALTRKLLAWSLGRSLSFVDDEEVERLSAKFREADYRVGPLIEEMVTSELFTMR
ncbi:MAG: DUF1592 domain-containing protein [Verrucomicrobiota bacterium]